MAFVVAHVWVAVVGIGLLRQESFYDVDLYRWWTWQGLYRDQWPVLGGPWVYPAGALLPMLAAAAVGTWKTIPYAVSWSVLVMLLDAAAMCVLLRRRGGGVLAEQNRAAIGGWWWLVFLVLLGPVSIGRLDAIVAPMVVVALCLAMRRTRLAATLLTAGAWIKVAPGALLLPLVLAARRPVRDVVLPAAVVCVVVVGAVVALGGGANVTSFLSDQGTRGLQIESVGATPWLLAGLYSPSVTRYLDQELSTYEIGGPGTHAMTGVLGAAMFVAIAAAAVLLWWVRRRAVATGAWEQNAMRAAFVVRGAMVMSLLLIVFNKVGSPQYLGWIAPPVAVALALGLRRWRTTAWLTLVVAFATQLDFPLYYPQVLTGVPWITWVLAVRNVALVVLLAVTVRELVRDARPAAVPEVRAATGSVPDDEALSPAAAPPATRPAPGDPGRAGPAPAGTPG